MPIDATPRTILLQKVKKVVMEADETGLENYEFAPKPFREAIEEAWGFKGYSKNVFNVTDIMTCPRKVQLKMLADSLGAKERAASKTKWAVFRGRMWDKALSGLFNENQVLFTVVMNINGEVAFIRGRIDAIYVNDDGHLEVIDFKSVSDDALKKKRYLKNNYVLQVAFYAHVVGADEYSILAVSNTGFKYAKMNNERLKKQAYSYARKIVTEIVEAMKKGEITPVKELSECVYCPFRGICDEIKTVEDLEKELPELAKLGRYYLEP